MTQQTDLIEIVGGPGDWRLLESSLLGRGNIMDIGFATHSGRLGVHLSALDREDGSGRNWIFDGEITTGSPISGFYSLSRGKGWYKPVRHILFAINDMWPSYTIHNGPGLDNLMHSLFIGDSQNRYEVSFFVGEGAKGTLTKAIINGVKRVRDSQLEIKGYVVNSITNWWIPFTAKYDTHSRVGGLYLKP